MRFFVLMDFKHMTLAFFLGLVALILVYLAWAGYPSRSHKFSFSDDELKEPTGTDDEPKAGETKHPFPPFLMAIYIGILACSIAYMFFVGVRGGPVGY